MDSNFAQSLDLVLRAEDSKYDTKPVVTNDPRDKGGWTKYGVTRKALGAFLGREATPDDVKNLTLETASKIYRQDYWNAVKADSLPVGVDYLLFDCAVNQGPVTAIKILQRTLGVEVDGRLGPVSFSRIKATDIGVLINGFCANRVRAYQALADFAVYGNGWVRRVNALKVKARQMAGIRDTV